MPAVGSGTATRTTDPPCYGPYWSCPRRSTHSSPCPPGGIRSRLPTTRVPRPRDHLERALVASPPVAIPGLLPRVPNSFRPRQGRSISRPVQPPSAGGTVESHLGSPHRITNAAWLDAARRREINRPTAVVVSARARRAARITHAHVQSRSGRRDYCPFRQTSSLESHGWECR